MFDLNCLRLTFEPQQVKLVSCALKALGLSTFTNNIIKKHNW